MTEDRPQENEHGPAYQSEANRDTDERCNRPERKFAFPVWVLTEVGIVKRCVRLAVVVLGQLHDRSLL